MLRFTHRGGPTGKMDYVRFEPVALWTDDGAPVTPMEVTRGRENR
jgi:hypothetical protein